MLPLTAFSQEPARVDPYDQSKVALEVEPPADFKGKRVLIVAGRESHGPGDHEFFAGSAILFELLKQNKGDFPIMARDGWPKNEKLFDTADCIVMYMDGGGGHPAIKPERMAIIQKQLDRGAGWVNIHYAVEYPVKDRDRDIAGPVKGWLGGYYETGYSINPHWDAEIRSLPKHPITRGSNLHNSRRGYYGMRWIDDIKGRRRSQAVPLDARDDNKRAHGIETWPGLLSAKTADVRSASPWHFHRNWAEENFRRLVVNAILWTAKEDVPESGAKVEFDAADLNKNLDKKKGDFKPILPPGKK